MKKVLRVILWSIVGILIAAYIFLFAAYNGYKPDKIEIEASIEATDYFNDTYEECRAEFISEAEKLQQIYSGVEVSKFQVPSKTEQELYVDLLYIPAQDTAMNLLVLTSGIHGVEGFTGSAVQMMTIKEIINQDLLGSTGLLIIHGLNPYGFKNIRRVSENNIDLNRNCAIDPALYDSKNEGYGNLYDMLNPTKEADHANSRNRNYHLIAVQKILAESMPVLRQAVLQGQYEFPEGLYFGGEDLEPQFKLLKPILSNIMSGYELVATIDLHTGYGENGKLHLFPNPIEDPVVKGGLEDLFDGYEINWGDSDDFYTISGSYVDWVGSISDVQTYLPMVFEYGTLDSQKTLGSIRSLHNMILENQGFHHGYRNDKTKKKIINQFREMYYPSSPEWQTKVIQDSKEVLEKVFDRLK